jgi:hypothetical protein
LWRELLCLLLRTLGLTYFAYEFFHDVGNVDLTDTMAAENPKNENVQSF